MFKAARVARDGSFAELLIGPVGTGQRALKS